MTREEEGEIKRIALIITATLLVIGMIAALGSVREARALVTTYIRADGSIEPPAAPIQKNGDIFTLTNNIASDFDGIVVERNNTILDGAGLMIQGTSAPSSKGIYLSIVSNVTIKNMKVKAFESGISLYSSVENDIVGNDIAYNTYGILADTYSTQNRIEYSNVTHNDYGINYWSYSDFNVIIGNNLTANNFAGVWIVGSSGNNITKNTFADNGQYGISLETSSNNIIYHNDFINNVNQVYLYDSTGIWDNGYPSGGNYWSDYSGVDSNGDGIGDTPYTIDEDNQDRYPFMKPWTNIAISKIALSKNIVGQGLTVKINVHISSQGNFTETFNVTVYANMTSIAEKTITLTSGIPTTLTFTWNTSGFARAYVISANVTILPEETDTADNTLIDGIVKVSCIGDINGDYVTDISDYQFVKRAIPSRPGDPKWNPNADVNDDLVIDVTDYQTVKRRIPSRLP